MKKIILLTIAFLAILNLANAQESKKERWSSGVYKMTDTVPKVFYINNTGRDSLEVTINGKKYPSAGTLTFKSDKIMTVEYPLIMTLAADYKPRYISLTELTKKYTKLSSELILYKIDDRVIKINPDEVLVDESNIMCISIEPIKTNKGLDDIYIINLKPRSEENVNDANDIRIR